MIFPDYDYSERNWTEQILLLLTAVPKRNMQ